MDLVFCNHTIKLQLQSVTGILFVHCHVICYTNFKDQYAVLN